MTKENIKVTCSLDDNFNCEKFLKLRLKVCHDGVNKNNSIFSIDSFEKAKNSISLIPILANVVRDENGEYQFAGHDMTIEKNAFDGTQSKTIYKEVPIGFVPVDCNYELETIDDKTYVNVDGYVWKEYSNYAQEIIERDEVINLSMEILVNSYEEIKCSDNQTRMNITDFVYTGITFLGNNVEPAMYDACAKLINFSIDKNVNDVISEMSKQLNSILNKNNEPQIESNKQVNSTNKFEKFAIDLNSVHTNIFNYLFDIDEKNNFKTYSSLIEWTDLYFIYSYMDKKYKCKFFKANYSVDEENNINIINTIELYNEFLTSEEKNELDEMRNSLNKKNKEISCLQKEVQELREFKDTIINEQKHDELMEIISKWNDSLFDCNEFNELKNNLDVYSTEELNIRCKCIFADKQFNLMTQKNNKQKDIESSNVVSFSFESNKNKEKVEKSKEELLIEKFLN